MYSDVKRPFICQKLLLLSKDKKTAELRPVLYYKFQSENI